MFTTEPSLAQRIARMIGDTPVIDPRTTLRPDASQVPHLAALMGHPAVLRELRAVGMPRADLDPALPADERVRRSIPFLRRTRNTATAWCLFRIFRDLYDFGDAHLTESNYRELADKVAAKAADKAWPREVLDRCNIRAVATDARPGDGFGELAPSVLFAIDGAGLLPAWGPGGRAYLDRLATALGATVDSADRLGRALRDRLAALFADRARYTLLNDVRMGSLSGADRAEVDGILARAARGDGPANGEECSLAAFLVDTVLGWHDDQAKPVALAITKHNLAPEVLAGCFDRFPRVRFTLAIDHFGQAEPAAALAAEYPNVAVAAYPDGGLLPGTIESVLTSRVHALPMTKFVGFVSDAPNIEWIYGKFQVAKKATSSTFAALVEAGYYEEDEVPPILQQILGGTAAEFLDLNLG